MKLTCPECGAEIAAEHINVQQMVAVCHECNAVFSFDVSAARRKRRKVRQPERLELSEGRDRLTMRYRRVYSEEEQGLGWGTIVMTLMGVVITIAAVVYQAPVIVSLLIAGMTLFSAYVMAALWLNQTAVTIDDERLAVQYGPLPWTTGAANIRFDRQQIASVYCEETEKSRDTVSANRFYHVRGRLVDGDTVTLFKGMPQDYALYIAQEINAMLENDNDLLTGRLQDHFAEDDRDQPAVNVVTATHQQRHT